MIEYLKNKELKIEGKKSISYDLSLVKDAKKLVIFCHGYKGFKNWGAWDLVSEEFVNEGFSFCKFNFSHNGGTIENPIDFPDLEAFGNNNYSLELDDLESLINFLQKEHDFESIHLIGHSRGGGIVLIKASENPAINSVTTWASVSDYASRFPTGEALISWEKQGVHYITNGRTKQKMPHYFQYYRDFKNNEERFTIRRAVEALKIPHLIVHGVQDERVDFSEAESLTLWSPHAMLVSLDTDHTFGTKHPWDKDTLSDELSEIVTKTIRFIRIQ